LDQFGDPFGFKPVWSATGGVVDATGRFTAGETGGMYEVTASDASGTITGTVFVQVTGPTGVEEFSAEVEFPTTNRLLQNYPNPFNPTTNIPFNVAEAGHASLRVYDLMGRHVVTLVDEQVVPGRYRARFDAHAYPSGPYFCVLEIGSFREVRSLVLLK
jgi:hypothetical protein